MNNWTKDIPLLSLIGLIKHHGNDARAVGGCVRDYLSNKEPNDIDLACTMLPEELIDLCDKAELKTIPTGIAHGTLTIILDNFNVEVTTLRKDVATDGRHATVAFTDDFEADAARRDFTINAMSMDLIGGKIYDYFGGQEDLAKNMVKFICIAEERIIEDALRILRYFRFLAKMPSNTQIDMNSALACKKMKSLLRNLSGERIHGEMKKILESNNISVIEHMIHCGLPKLVSGVNWDYNKLVRLNTTEQILGIKHNYITKLYAMTDETQRDKDLSIFLEDRWKISNCLKKHLDCLIYG